MKNLVLIVIGLLLLIALQPTFAEYVIGVDDVLEIVFWQQPDLNQVVVVNAEGKISLKVAGEITAASLTPSQLGRKIVENVSRFNREVSQAVVTVQQYNSNTVFVEGEVVAPGRYAREVIPDLWTVIKEMGGITEFGDLRSVQIIRGGTQDQGQILTVDVLDAVTSRNLASLPKVYPRDIIRVGRLPEGLTGGNLPHAADTRRNEFYITGAVARPGRYSLEPGMDLLEAIAVAGGYSQNANLKKVKVASKLDGYSNIYTINLEKHIETSGTPRYLLGPEDAIVLLERRSGIFGVGLSALRDVLTLGGSITSLVLLADRLSQ
ncbi:MAG: polysaccharide biosynthesis/export family protein [bacterium]